ncbi:ABC transporter substrate-binding protein [Thiosulfativibrio zosterae]|uniref:ABC transporter substrate-binding protein n=1 Tax=Thiosulfativibrio zosterae TaxID=2675053 RepID=A0A6F8PP32_9GAMM|nr:ABC transporter substrate-binding protein [Thiosulfativibrio zosterae]BBP43881.1 ABC transporter substrate-binding protein [Thiosulfativibrio zosterae]
MKLKPLVVAAFVGMTSLSSFSALANTAVKFTLDWKFEGPAAAYLVALEKGFYKEQGLDVTIDSGNGSLDAIPKVASGTYEFGFADVNSLIKFKDQNPDSPLQGILMVYDKPPFAIIGSKQTGVNTPKDLEGKVLGAPAPDGAYAQWKAFTQVAGIDASKVKIDNVSFAVRESMLVQKRVDAIAGFSFSSFLNLKKIGMAPEDIHVMLMADYGLKLYGNTLLVNPAFAEAHPDLVKGFVAATIKGWQYTAAHPEESVKYVLERNKIANEAVETERLKMCLKDNVVTDNVKANGFGGIDYGRMDEAIEQVGMTYDFHHKPTSKAIFTDAYLPAKSAREM